MPALGTDLCFFDVVDWEWVTGVREDMGVEEGDSVGEDEDDGVGEDGDVEEDGVGEDEGVEEGDSLGEYEGVEEDVDCPVDEGGRGVVTTLSSKMSFCAPLPKLYKSRYSGGE